MARQEVAHYEPRGAAASSEVTACGGAATTERD